MEVPASRLDGLDFHKEGVQQDPCDHGSDRADFLIRTSVMCHRSYRPGILGQGFWAWPYSEVWGFFLLLMLPSSPAPEPTEQEAEEELRADGQGFMKKSRVSRGHCSHFNLSLLAFFVKTMETQGGVSSSSCSIVLKWEGCG